jgi:hypothetical protein
MFEYHQSNQKQANEIRSYLLTFRSGRACGEYSDLAGQHAKLHDGANRYFNESGILPHKVPVKTFGPSGRQSETIELRSTPTSTEKQADDDRIRWRQPTEVGGYISHREQWL